MNIRINGKAQPFTDAELAINDIIERNNIESPDMVAVQINGEFIERDQFSTPLLKDGDEVDFLYFMGGGN